MRRVLQWSVLAAFGLAFSAACGGGGDGGSGPSGGGGALTAKIDGAPWSSSAGQLFVNPGSTGVPGSLIIIASQVNGSNVTTIQFSLGFVKFQAIYPLGVNAGTTPGGTATITHSTSSSSETRMTPLDGESGTFQIVTRTGNHITGTFSFVAQPLLGSSLNTNETVTEGTFDIDLPAGFTDLGTTNYGSDIHATLNGDSFYGATVVALGANGAFSMGAQTTTKSLSILNTTPVNGAATLNLLSGVRITIVDLTTSHSWGGISGDTGSVRFSGSTGGRAVGTFSGTLRPNNQGDAPITITGGSFNVRVDAP